jgi:hypothetical protein
MKLLTVKRFVFEHWEILAMLIGLALLISAIHGIVDNIFFKPRREKEAKRIKSLEEQAELARSVEMSRIEDERKAELRKLLERLKSNDEILESHAGIIESNWNNWSSEKISSQIKVSAKSLEELRIEQKAKADLEAELLDALESGKVSAEIFNMFKRRIENENQKTLKHELQAEIAKHARRLALIQAFGDVDGQRIMNGEYWLGMTEVQLIESIGQPTLIQKEVLKTKEKVIYIYGKKTTGDVFVFVNGLLESLKDR